MSPATVHVYWRWMDLRMTDHGEALLALLRTDEAPASGAIRLRQKNGPAPAHGEGLPG
ncbi:hypothetical protein [Nitrococcus mobilis]|nr:hypothetical protein [Nitrococcus mobilis]